MYELVSPVHVQGSRHRRSLLEAKDPLRYDLTAFGEEFQLHLDHNDQLIAPGTATVLDMPRVIVYVCVGRWGGVWGGGGARTR